MHMVVRRMRQLTHRQYPAFETELEKLSDGALRNLDSLLRNVEDELDMERSKARRNLFAPQKFRR